ncbi:unnamed protein product [Euphydryas editha]|uniref:Reverse transcriptase domain-containing protein n=1 Tax=Euphydryas editha TaxID=104508 RepID=A0AAU9U5G5_EUPED|nr:unnamed protein product [Euphydryas editha]
MYVIPTLRDYLHKDEEDVLLALYADSAIFMSSFHQVVASNKMQCLLKLLPKWVDKCRMAVNVRKTVALFTGGCYVKSLRGQDVEWHLADLSNVPIFWSKLHSVFNSRLCNLLG